jgi:hypothetical protein
MEQFSSIGWFQFTLGRVSKKWASALQLLHRTWSDYVTPTHTISLLINHLRQFLAAMWNHPNTIVHGATVEEQASRVITSLLIYRASSAITNKTFKITPTMFSLAINTFLPFAL